MFFTITLTRLIPGLATPRTPVSRYKLAQLHIKLLIFYNFPAMETALAQGITLK